MKRIFYLWILPIVSWMFFLSIFVSIIVFESVTSEYVSETVGYSFVACLVVLFFLSIVFFAWYTLTTGSMRGTRKIVMLWMSRYFNSEKIEFNILSELNFDSKTIDTTISFNGLQLKFYTENIIINRRYETIFWFNKIKKYEKHLEDISLDSKQSLAREIQLLTDKKTTLYLYKDEVEIKSQAMPRRFPFIYSNFSEFKTEMNAFINRESIKPDLELEASTLNKEKTT